MANVVRFVLPSARDLVIPGVGWFVHGVLDVDAADIERVLRARYLVQPYQAVEVGIVDSDTPPPSLPSEPVPPPADPYPQYIQEDEADAKYMPLGAISDATEVSKGIIQLAGDLGGTADAPTVPGLVGITDRANHTGTQAADTIGDLTESVQDIVGAFVKAGVNTTVSYDDVAGTFTINATSGTGGSTDPEIVRDVIGAALVAGIGIQIVYDDTLDTLTVSSPDLAAATDATTASTLVKRDASGVSRFAQAKATAPAPVGVDDLSRKDYVDGKKRTPTSFRSTDFTLALADEGTMLMTNNSSGNLVVTVPADATANFPVGAWVDVARWQVGSANIAPAAGVSVNAPGGGPADLNMPEIYSVARLTKVAANAWIMSGKTNDSTEQALAGATSSGTVSTLVKRDGNGHAQFGRVYAENTPPSTPNELTRKDYVDAIKAAAEGIVFHDGTAGGGIRPTGYARVTWVSPPGSGHSRPTNMLTNDAWETDV